MQKLWQWVGVIALVMMMVVASPASAQSDRRLNPHDAEYYSIFCSGNHVSAYLATGSLVTQIPLAYILGLDEAGGNWELDNGMAVKRNGDTITVSGTNGNFAPAYGAKDFSLNLCLSYNGSVPEPKTIEPAAEEALNSTSSAEVFDCKHVVESGDSAWGVVLQYDTTLEQLAVYNSLDENYMLFVGQELILPGCAGVAAGLTAQTVAGSSIDPFASTIISTSAQQDATTHIVELGEMLAHIAAEYDTTIDAIMSANDLDDPNFIYEGQNLIIPAR